MGNFKRSDREVLEAARQLYRDMLTGEALVYFVPTKSWKEQDTDIDGALSLRSESGKKWDWLVNELQVNAGRRVSVKSEMGASWARFIAMSGSSRIVTTNKDTSLLTGIPVHAREPEGTSNAVGAFLKEIAIAGWNVGKPGEATDEAKKFSDEVFAELGKLMRAYENRTATRLISRSELLHILEDARFNVTQQTRVMAYALTGLMSGLSASAIAAELHRDVLSIVPEEDIRYAIVDLMGRTPDSTWKERLSLVQASSITPQRIESASGSLRLL